MTTKILKLKTGEELVADITFKGQVYTLVKPFMLQMARDPSGQKQELQLALFPYAPYTKDHIIHVSKENVIWFEDLPESMIRDYNTALVNLAVTLKKHEDSDITDV
jgi:hypothetical protein